VCGLQALYWSLGAALMEDGREKFDSFVKEYAAMPIRTVADDNLCAPGEIPGMITPRTSPIRFYVVSVLFALV